MRTAPAAAVNRPLIIRAAIAFAAATLVCSAPASADPVADFYRGKTLRMLIGYGPGGGYDIYGRLVAEFLPRHLPGNPTIVAQNMPGAGSFVAAKYIPFTMHPYIIGRPGRTLALRGIIHHMKAAGNLWFPTGIELAEYCLKNLFKAECQKLHASAG